MGVKSKPGVSNRQVVLESFERPCICVATTLKEYLVRTKAMRGSSQSELLLSYVKPYKPVSRDTVSRWVRRTLALAGIDMTKYSAHSTRAASVSAASRANVNIDDILQIAGWSSECCFAHIYNKPIAKVSSMQDQSCHLCKMYHLHITIKQACCFFMSVLL